ncbi:MAG: ribonuclease Y, partial [Chloroflexi bacterium]
MIWWIAAAAAFVVGGTIGILVQRAVFARKSREALEKASKIMAEAEAKARQVLLEAKEEAVKIKSEAETETRRLRSELSRQERKLSQRLESLERRSESLERREQNLRAREREIEEELSRVEKFKQEARQQLEVIAQMSSAEAREYLLQMVENEVRDDLAKRMLQVEAELKAEADERAREIIANAIQRCASEVSTETTVSVVHLPSDEMKGRLIGREGRNIRALESATGVDLIVDDTPEAVALSCFDPFRREIARRALEKLILDGRIHPARIEEMVEKARKEVETDVREEGEKVALSLGVVGLHPELLKLLGR